MERTIEVGDWISAYGGRDITKGIVVEVGAASEHAPAWVRVFKRAIPVHDVREHVKPSDVARGASLQALPVEGSGSIDYAINVSAWAPDEAAARAELQRVGLEPWDVGPLELANGSRIVQALGRATVWRGHLDQLIGRVTEYRSRDGATVTRAEFLRELGKRPKTIKPARWRELTARENPPRRGKLPPAKAIVYVTGHNGDPAKMDTVGAGGFLSIQQGGDHRIDKGTAQRRPAIALAKAWMDEHPPLSTAALVEVVEQSPTGAREELGRWGGAPRKRGGGLEWVAQAKPRRAPPVKRAAPTGTPWKKEPQFLFAAPEHRQRTELTAQQFGVAPSAVPVAAPVAAPAPPPPPPPPPRRSYEFDRRGQGVLLNPKPKRARKVRENKGGPSRSIVRKADGSAVVIPSLAKVTGKLAVGRWHVLRRGGEWNANVREALRGRNFVYAIREASNPSTVLYVGEAHSAKWKRPKLEYSEIETVDVDDRGRPLPVCALPAASKDRKRRAKVAQPLELRGWKTLLHHFQDPDGKFRDVNEWTWHRTGDLEIAIWFVADGADYCAAKSKALDLEYAKTLRLRPLHTSISFQRQEAPF